MNEEISLKKKIGAMLDVISQPLVAVGLSFLLGAVVILICGEDVFKAYGSMLNGAFGDAYYISGTLSRATPIIMGGLAVCIAWRSGYEAMGGEGQMIFGAFVAALIGYYMPAPGIVRVIVSLLAAALVGALYSILSGWLYEKFEVTFIISTLMLNYVANNICSYLTNFVVKDPTALDINSIQTGKIAAEARLPKILEGNPNFTLHWGFILAVLCVIIVYVLFSKTSFGYKSRMNGLNPRFALYGGINARRMLYLVLILSGVMAGLGGAFEALGSKYRYVDQMIFTTGYAWSGMVAALLANYNPIGTAVASVLLAGLKTGASAMQRSTSIPLEVSNMIEGLIMLLMSVRLIRTVQKRSRAHHSAKEAKSK